MTGNFPNLPAYVTLDVTEVCNLRCKMCYAWGETGCYTNPESDMKPEVLDFDIVKQLIKDVSPRKPNYSLFGGEPLTYPHLEELIVAVKEAGSVIDTPTNGTLLKKHAKMLVETRFDSIRVSLDGPEDANDAQRGAGSYDKAMAGIEELFRERAKPGTKGPLISIIYTVTPANYLFIEQLFLKDLDLDLINFATIQTQNFVTESMGLGYAKLLESEFGITSDCYWRGMLRDPCEFDELDFEEMSRQINNVRAKMWEKGKFVITLPQTISADGLRAYFGARWGDMDDQYKSCPIPWASIDVMASGDIAPCHVFFDLTVGNLHENRIEEIWNGEGYEKLRAYIKKNGLMSICHGCCILYISGQKVG